MSEVGSLSLGRYLTPCGDTFEVAMFRAALPHTSPGHFRRVTSTSLGRQCGDNGLILMEIMDFVRQGVFGLKDRLLADE